mgnify:CR=1 FL=1
MDNSENHRFNESESNSNSMYTSESERNNNERHSESLIATTTSTYFRWTQFKN